jgi:hypothetical protein
MTVQKIWVVEKDLCKNPLSQMIANEVQTVLRQKRQESFRVPVPPVVEGGAWRGFFFKL